MFGGATSSSASSPSLTSPPGATQQQKDDGDRSELQHLQPQPLISGLSPIQPRLSTSAAAVSTAANQGPARGAESERQRKNEQHNPSGGNTAGREFFDPFAASSVTSATTTSSHSRLQFPTARTAGGDPSLQPFHSVDNHHAEVDESGWASPEEVLQLRAITHTLIEKYQAEINKLSAALQQTRQERDQYLRDIKATRALRDAYQRGERDLAEIAARKGGRKWHGSMHTFDAVGGEKEVQDGGDERIPFTAESEVTDQFLRLQLQKLVNDNERLKLALERQKQRQRAVISQKVTEALTAAAMRAGSGGLKAAALTKGDVAVKHGKGDADNVVDRRGASLFPHAVAKARRGDTADEDRLPSPSPATTTFTADTGTTTAASNTVSDRPSHSMPAIVNQFYANFLHQTDPPQRKATPATERDRGGAGHGEESSTGGEAADEVEQDVNDKEENVDVVGQGGKKGRKKGAERRGRPHGSAATGEADGNHDEWADLPQDRQENNNKSNSSNDDDDDDDGSSGASSIATPSPSAGSLSLTVTDNSGSKTGLFPPALNPRVRDRQGRREEEGRDSASSKPEYARGMSETTSDPAAFGDKRTRRFGKSADNGDGDAGGGGGGGGDRESLFSSTSATSALSSIPFLYQIPRTPAEALANEAKLLKSVKLLREENAALQSRLSLVERLLSNLHRTREKDRLQHAHAAELAKRRARDMSTALEDCQSNRFACEERAATAEVEVTRLQDLLAKKEAALSETKKSEALRIDDQLRQAREEFEREKTQWNRLARERLSTAEAETVSLRQRYNILHRESDEAVKEAMDLAQRAEAALADERRNRKKIAEEHRASQQLALADKQLLTNRCARLELQLASEAEKVETITATADLLKTQAETLAKERAIQDDAVHTLQDQLNEACEKLLELESLKETAALLQVTANAEAEEKKNLQEQLDAQTRILQSALATLQAEKDKETLTLAKQLERLSRKYDAVKIQLLSLIKSGGNGRDRTDHIFFFDSKTKDNKKQKLSLAKREAGEHATSPDSSALDAREALRASAEAAARLAQSIHREQ